jgi:hypothetical protein
LVNGRFLTGLNGVKACPAEFADGRALTLLFVEFLELSNWPEACSQP